jgi:hypothetical protein
VRLKDGDEAAVRELAQRAERCRDLGRMVGVVVEDERAARRPALALEPPGHAREGGEAGDHVVEGG